MNLTRQKKKKKEAGRVNWPLSYFAKDPEPPVILYLPLSALPSIWQLNYFYQMASFLFCWCSLWHFQKAQYLRLWYVLEMIVTGMHLTLFRSLSPGGACFWRKDLCFSQHCCEHLGRIWWYFVVRHRLGGFQNR